MLVDVLVLSEATIAAKGGPVERGALLMPLLSSPRRPEVNPPDDEPPR